MKKITFSLIAAMCFAFFLACKKDDPKPIIPTPVVPKEDTLFRASSIPIGVAIDPNLLKNNALYRGIVLKEYNSITCENAMKWSALHPSKDVFNFTDADYLMDFATTNKKRMFGHNLLWHTYNPAWIENFAGDSTAFETLMKTHIETVVKRYKGKVVAWDVVNEAFEDNGLLRTNSIWYKKLGSDYIARAFQYANAADPDALLFYNDYGQEYAGAKLTAILKMVADFKKRGIPIHGLGLQMHIGIATNDYSISGAIIDYAATGLKVHISELDINLSNYKKDPNLTLTDALKETQKQKFKAIVKSYKRNVPKAQQFGITNWNVGDADSWLRIVIQKNEYPLIFDENYAKKPAYTGFIEGLRE
jgi:endo-1,4-beta-xylanase